MIFALARLTKRNETISMREGKCVCVYEREGEREREADRESRIR